MLSCLFLSLLSLSLSFSPSLPLSLSLSLYTLDLLSRTYVFLINLFLVDLIMFVFITPQAYNMGNRFPEHDLQKHMGVNNVIHVVGIKARRKA